MYLHVVTLLGELQHASPHCFMYIFLELYCYGIRGTSLKWIEDYLTNRRQYVEYNTSNSKMGNVSIGVPQGSILGPLLFLVYVNDISNISKKLSCILFADDTNIFATGKTLHEIYL